MDGPPRLRTFYFKQVVPAVLQETDNKNKLAVPRLTKIVVNMGVSEAKDNVQALDIAREDLAAITGQRPEVRRATKSISNFKLREGMPIGVRVTLRGDRMYEFLDRLVTTAVPRIRDFRGLPPKGFDGRGNYNLGLREHHIFSEVDLERSPKALGMNITFVTTAGTDEDGLDLLGRMGLPFKGDGQKKG
ncbi:MAG: 50S ribosomal protein L5 [Elusimicrobiota bacterium]